ncbi:hypothetical protein CS0771_07390 [Catellatospora sp. IY07-71]|nr:hypothetical protein CS0771_07390 [Catellatospora sp. IY07-71]
MRTNKICALLGRGAIIAVLGVATVAAVASPAAARYSFDGDVVPKRSLSYTDSLEWGSAPAAEPTDGPAETGLEERSLEWG